MSSTLSYKPATLAHLDVIADLEAKSYHPDEAASREQLANRIKYATESDPNLFLVAWQGETIAGFVCTTLGAAPLVTDESMKAHDPNGKTVCLHSVCVNPQVRRQKVATRLMAHWIQVLKDSSKYNRIALLSRPNLIGLYESVGFKNSGKSQVVHGPDPWYDCILELQ
ncbi:acyl-CoA N-acyltransferase [Zychaea mexicana]|uniref:acyl-CoA N-acyltransferase n=1 Tax=Zychaea mexicana TaxID=64656 RepID=UPI0022FEFF9A|nr:acyl-CoA N-acyltransferase [Zychaea mexicana]KAI9470454.1 acyl-CoA N-acyltransferase [Zychaea mexicana]